MGIFFSGQVAMESLCTQDSENQQGVPEKSTFLKFQVYKSIWLFWTTLYPSKGLYWAIWIIWTVMDCWTISYNLFVWLVRNCHRDLWKILFLGHPVYERGVQIFYDPVFVTWSQVSATKCSRLAKIWGVTKNRYGHNFQNIGSKLNQRLLTGYEPTLICFGSDILKIATVSVFSDTAFIIVFFFQKWGSTLAAPNSA